MGIATDRVANMAVETQANRVKAQAELAVKEVGNQPIQSTDQVISLTEVRIQPAAELVPPCPRTPEINLTWMC